MKHPSLFSLIGFTLLISLASCKKDKKTTDPVDDSPTKETLNSLVREAELGMRTAIDRYLDVTGIIGREIYRFSPTENLYTTELLGSGGTTLKTTGFYFKEPWEARYEAIKDAASIIKGANRSTSITDAELRGFTGFAKTIIAYQLLLNLTLTETNGIYINLQADNPATGSVIPYTAALDSINRLLDEAKTTLPGSVIPPLTASFINFNEPTAFIKFNRALAARVALYRQQWAQVLTALNESFFDLNGELAKGPRLEFNVSGDNMMNPCFIAQNQTDQVRLAHPSYATDITAGDDRIQKASLRTEAKTQDGLVGNRDVWIFTSNVAPIPIINNEELILLYSEAKIQLNQFPDGIVALNRIRIAHNLPAYAGSISQAALLDHVLYQRRYSLFGLGHRWVDLRRFSKLNTLPLDRPGDDVWDKFPLP